jgi:non-ribosomal peptide synthetase component F
MLHSLATAQVSLEKDGRMSLSEGAILRGPARPDLIRDELLCEIFAATAARHPDAIAMITAEGNLTYAEVDAKAEALAHGLLQKGVCPGRIVGLWMPRGHELLIAQIAIAKTGAAWLPFDADAPAERIAICLSDAEARGIWTTSSFAEKLAAPCPAWTFAGLLADAKETLDAAKIDARALGARPDDPAYFIYTSGSTGTPKGIAISGRNICHYLRAANEIYGVLESDVVFQGASVAFDLSMEEIWLPYLVGASLFVASAEMMGEADKLPGLLEAHRVSVLDTVPTLLSLLPRDVASLRRDVPAFDRQPLVQARAQNLQFLRPYRDNGRRHRRGSAARPAGHDRAANSKLHVLCGGREPRSSSARRGRRASHRRTWCRKGLFAPRPAHPREIYRQSFYHQLYSSRSAGPCFVQVWRRRPDRRERRNRLPRSDR